MRPTIFKACLIIVSTLVLSSCKKENKNDTFYGAQVAVGNGNARTFFSISSSGVPQEIGVVFTSQALSDLPKTNTTYVLNIHEKAIKGTLFKNVVVGLSASGHGLPPAGHIEAHFDVRFFMMPNEERDSIQTPASPLYPPPAGGGFDVFPARGFLPENYVMNYAVAKMGRHWASNSFPSGTHVDHTMIYGTYNGELTFIAPIVTVAHLATGSSHSVAFPQPEKFAKQGYYATKYNITKDGRGSHTITLSDFIWR